MASATIDPATGLPKKKTSPNPISDVLNSAQVASRLARAAAAGGGSSTPYNPAAPYGGPASIDVGGFSPDYKNLINNDPGYLQMETDLSAAGISDAAQRDAAVRRAFGQFGIIPDFSNIDLGALPADIDSLVDPNTRALAEANTRAGLSTQFRLDQAHQDAVRNITNALNATGRLHSGDAGFQLGREQQNYQQANYDATQKLLDYVAGVQAAFAANQQQRAVALGQGASAAADRQAALPQNTPHQTVPAQFKEYDDAGVPKYQAADGSWWTPLDPSDPSKGSKPYAPSQPPLNGFDARPSFRVGHAIAV